MRRIIEEERSAAKGQAWSDIIDVARSEIYSDGRLLLVKIRGTNPHDLMWFSPYDFDSLILHE